MEKRSKFKITGGFQDTRLNQEDFALTPYLFLVKVSFEPVRIYGIGICFGYYAAYIGIGFNLPTYFQRFKAIVKR